MTFISNTNKIMVENITLQDRLITVHISEKTVTFSYTGDVDFFNDTDDLVGAYIDSNHNIKLTYQPEYSDTDVDDEALSMLDYNKEFIIEYIVEQTYINEMKYRKED